MTDGIEAFIKKYSTTPDPYSSGDLDWSSSTSSSSSYSSSSSSSTISTSTKSSFLLDKFSSSSSSSTLMSEAFKSIGDYTLESSVSSSSGGGGGGSGGGEESFSYFDPRFPKWLSIILLVVGIFGNLLCLFIFSRKNMRKNSTFIYLACLSVIDLAVLTLGLGDIVLIAYLNFNMRNQLLAACRVISFLIYSFTHLSSFILASVSIDRAIATNFITFSKAYCRPITAYKVISINIALAVLINFHSLFFIGHTSVTPAVSLSNNFNEENGKFCFVTFNFRLLFD